MAIALRGTPTTSGSADTLSTSKTVAVPTGAAIDDIAILIVDQWTSAAERTAAATGFTEITAAHATRTTVGTAGTQTIRMFWKRLTAADTGNYTVTFTGGSTWNLVHCVMLSGGLTSGDPIEVVNTANAASGYPTTSFTVATLAALVNAAATFNGITTTPPTSFTEQQDTNVLHTNTWILTSAGAITASGGGVSAAPDTIVVAMIAVMPASGGGTTLTVANVAQAQSVQATTLTQVHNLTVANVAQAQHPTTPTLTQVHVLVPVGVAQAQHPTSPTLVQNSSLTVANVGQSQSITVPTLTQVHQLAAADVGQAQHPTAPALTQAHQLDASGVGQAQGPAAPALTQTHVLAVAGVAQAQAPGTVALTQAHVLAVSEAGQAQHPANVTLSGPGTLAVANAGQSQTPGTPALTQTHNLVVAGVHQSQSPAAASLVLTGSLVVSGVGQVQSTSPVTLTQAHQLVIAAAIQGQSVPPTTITQAHQLVVDGVTQGQVPGAALIFVIPPGGELDNWLTLGDLMDARATHELIMIDQISARHPGMIEGVFDPDLGYAPAEPKPSYYTGKATVQARQISAGQLSPAGLGTLTQLGYAVHGPVGTAIDQAAPDDVITVTDSADPRYVGLVLIVRNVESSSFVTARRLICTVYEPSTP